MIAGFATIVCNVRFLPSRWQFQVTDLECFRQIRLRANKLGPKLAADGRR
jgi:hypothetical protein